MDVKYRILVVDDDPIFSKSTQAVLEAHGYQVEVARNGAEGLSKMEELAPDLVILDVMMDWALEGVNVSNEMMQQRNLWDIPIVMVTSIRSSDYRGLFPQDQYLHINAWLDKPCPPEKLIATVASTLTRHERFKEVTSND
jgi:CheY-like chemotaxis protein